MAQRRRQQKNKKPKDPNAPKRSLSSYFLFLADNRQKVKQEKPELKMIEITKEMSKRWKNIDRNSKKEYENKAKSLKEEYAQRLNEYKTTDQYQQFQKKLQRWKEEQNDKKESDANKNNGNSEKKIQKKKSKPKVKAKAKTKINKSEINSKINSFFERYRDRLRKSKWPREAVSNQYGWGIEEASKWIVNELSNKQLNINDAMYGFYRLVIFKANIEMMDFSGGGPGFEIGLFMESIENVIDKYDIDQFEKKMVKQFYDALCKYYQTWDAYSLSDDIKQTVEKMKQKWSF